MTDRPTGQPEMTDRPGNQPGAGAPGAFRRRAFLRAALGATGLAALTACGGASPTPTTGGATAPTATSAPARPTAAATPAAGAGVTPTGVGAPTTAAATAATGPTATVVAAQPAATAGARPATAAAAQAGADGRIPSPAPGVPDAYTKFPTPFKSVANTPGTGGTVTTFQIAELAPVPPRGENRYWQELEQRLGVKVEPTFGPTSSWAEKFAALTAGGDLPDLCWLYPQDPRGVAQYRTIQQGAFTDLTPYVTGDALKEYPNLATFPANAWRNIAINGKIYGVPRPNFLVATLNYRQDWLDKLGLAKPANADQFLGMLTAFTKNDPNGNGAPDTYGLGSIVPAHLMSLNFVRYMFRVPDQWRKNADNTLTASVESEEYKGALAFARRLHEAGVYHPDAPTMTPAQGRDGFDAGKFGAFNAAITGLSGRRTNSKKVDPAADPRLLIPFGHDGDKAIAYNGAGHVGWTAISAKAGRDRERVKELLRILDYYAAPFGSEERIFLSYGLEGVHHTVRPNGSRAVTDAGRAQIGDLPNLTNQAPVFYYDEAGLAPYMQGTLRDLYAIGVDNPTVNLFAPSAGTKGPELNQLVNDKEIAFITGREPLGAIDAFVRDWRNRGGDQIRTEYEQALKA